MNRILIIQTAFLGDVILATAMIAECHRLFPQAQIDVLVKKGNDGLLTNNPKIHRVFTLDKSKGKFKEILRLRKAFRSNHYDIVFNLHRFGSSGILAALSGAENKYGFDKNPFSFLYTKKFKHVIGDGTHEVTRNMQMLDEFGGSKICKPELFPSVEDISKIASYSSKPYVCLAPASVWYTKALPKDKWVELIGKIDSQFTIYLIGAQSDIELCTEIEKLSKRENIIILAGQLTLLESAALMKGAKRCYVNDSGPLHIASAVNAPVTAFFCSTVPDFGFGPLSDESEIKEVHGLDCKPCGLHGFKSCPKGHFKCGKEMNLD